MIAARQAAGHGVFVAEEGGGIAGFASYGQFRGGIGYVRSLEHTVLLDPGARGRSVGRALMDAVLAHAAAAGGHVMIAGVSGENDAGKAFHAAIGFDFVARVPEVGWKFGRYLDLWLYQKILT